MEKKEFICINCPVGCRLTTVLKDGAVTEVSGNGCARGDAYARQEAVSPRRVLVCLMRCANRSAPVSVKSTAPIPKELLFRCAGEIYRTRPNAPVEMHQTVIRNICGTGADIVTTNALP